MTYLPETAAAARDRVLDVYLEREPMSPFNAIFCCDFEKLSE